MVKKIYIIAGEISGDIHAAALLNELKLEHPDLAVHGRGGECMRKVAGASINNWLNESAVMGVVEVLKKYSWFKKQFDRMVQELQELQPQVLLLIDYPGFNLRFAKAIRKKCPHIKIVQYVCPQVWAWNSRRIPKMAQILDEVLCLFPFEPDYFKHTSLKATFIGHPLVDELEHSREPNLERDPRLVGLFPGSREREVAMLLPDMIDAALLLHEQDKEIQFIIAAADQTRSNQILDILHEKKAETIIQVSVGNSHVLMQTAYCGIVASGTATLEAAYYGMPYFLVYRVHGLTYRLAKILVKIRFIGLVNILANREAVKEIIQHEVTPIRLKEELIYLLKNDVARENLSADLIKITSLLGKTGTHQRAAQMVGTYLKP